MKKIWIFYLLIILSSPLYAQNTISGRVSGEDGVYLPGVSVVVKGTTQGMSTDANGNYSLKAPENSVLVFSFIGCQTQEVKVKGTKPINVVMKNSTEALDEVVVVGYGTMKRSDVTGSVTTVKVDPREATQVNTVDKLLQGKAAGIDVVSGNGAPGAALNVKIRGVGTLTGNTEPLYVVDGVIINTASQEVPTGFQNGNYTQETQNGLTDLNPQDIESIEILKDASATAIYGSRGANGVVLITTKKGTSGKGIISFSTNTQISTVSKKIPLLDGKEFAQYDNELSGILGRVPKYSVTPAGLDSLQTINWQDYAEQISVNQIYRLTMSGKAEKTNYYVAGGFSDNQGIIKTTGVKTGDFRINLIQEVNSRLKLSSNTGITYQNNNWVQGTERLGQANSSMIRSMLRKSPLIGIVVDPTVEDGFLSSESPKTWFDEFQDKSNEFRVISSLNVDYKFSKVFSYRLTLGGDYRNKSRQLFWGPDLWAGSTTNGKATYAELRSMSYDIENLLLINKAFGKFHKLNGTIGITYDSNSLVNNSAQGDNFFNTTLQADGIGLAQVNYPFNFNKNTTSVLSALSRAEYSYHKRYLLTATIRADGASKFAPGRKFGYFPSAAFAWRASEEDFIRNLNLFSNLKFRFGWGLTGVQTIGAYQTQALYNFVQYPNPDKSLQAGEVSSRISNNQLTWEHSKQYNIGTDIGFYKDRLTVNVDVYNKTSSDLLQNFRIAPSSGFSTIAMNIGSIENKGLEITMNGVIIDKTVKWSLGGNIAFNRNKLLNLGLPSATWGTQDRIAYQGVNVSTGNQLKTPANIFIQGEPVGLFWGYKTDGIYQYSDTTTTLIYNGTKLVPGDIKFVDQNKDGIIDAKDQTIIGNPNPDFTYGINTSFSYKNLKLDLYFNGVYGRDICNANLVFEEYASIAGNNIRKAAWDGAWRPDNQSNSYTRIGYTLPTELNDRFIENGSYLRMSNISLSYSIPVEKLKIFSKLGVSISGQNLFIITKYKGFDPDVNSFTNNGNIIGVDFNSYPSQKSINIGLNASF
ncbi:MAG: TonB-dependent receptor [Bacteroidetes bacterium]|nr:TonB-dependent receptor [Bacteroidota bacterium]MCL6102329.1 TonB-dependent receptor [Bacteroidota bacterium]